MPTDEPANPSASGYTHAPGERMPKIVDRDERRNTIATAALGLLLQDGFESTSIADIAKAAGMGKGTVYEYYSSKDDIAMAALHLAVASMEAGFITQLQSIEHAGERLRAFVNLNVQQLVIPNSTPMVALVFEIMASLNKRHGAQSLSAFESTLRELQHYVVTILLDGISTGCFRPEIARDVHKIAMNLIILLDGMGMYRYVALDYFDVEEQIDMYMRRLLTHIELHPTKTC
ncbi:MAG: AcrR family transcriptional regulator [Kiritimatiellia bacterium]|jgi:AcrR family transcriptional regulator